MKKFFIKHGKKVSAGLLAIALMVSPMLNLVSAAESNECEIRYHYYFLEAENAYIQNEFIPTKDQEFNIFVSGGPALSGGANFIYKAPDNDKLIQKSYTSQYISHFGFDIQNMMGSNTVLANVFANGGSFVKGNTYVDKNGTTILADKASVTNTNPDPQYTLPDSVLADSASIASIQNSSSLKMTSDAKFYNLDVPEGYKIKSQTFKKSWTDDEWNIYVDMNINAIKAYKNNSGTLSSKDTSYKDGEDYYFVHYTWTNSKTENDNNGYLKNTVPGNNATNWFDTDGKHAMNGIFYTWANWTGGMDSSKKEVQDVIAEFKKASIELGGQTIWDPAIGSNNIGNTALAPVVTLSITRDYRNLKKPTSFWAASVPVANNTYDTTKGTAGEDTYNWYFFPSMGTITFTAPAEYCKTEENTGGDNVKTGIASYALIGTLLVGAGSAYIYARKNNKFNRL